MVGVEVPAAFDSAHDGPDVAAHVGVARARGEAVAGGEVLRGRDRARNLVEPPEGRLDREDRAEKPAGVFVARVGHQLDGRGLLDHLAGVHHRDGVGHLGHEGEVVGDEHHREAEFVAQLVEQFDDLLLNGDVEGGGGLVCDDELGVAGQRHGDEDALALASRELVRIGVEGSVGVEPDELQQILHRPRSPAFGQLFHLGFDEHRRVEGGQRVLVDHRELVPAQRVALGGRELQEILAVVEDLAGDFGPGIEQSHDCKGRDGLAAARFAHEAHRFARPHREADVVHHVDVAVARELDAQILDLKKRRLLGNGNVAVFPQGLHFLERVEPVAQRLGLEPVRGHGVHEHLVGFAFGVGGGLGNVDRALRRRDYGVGHPLREHVEAQDREHDGQAREEGGPPVVVDDAGPGVCQEIAPRRRRLLDAGLDEGERGLEDDGVRHEDGCEDHDRGDAVARHVLDEDPGGAGAGDDHGVDVVLAVFGYDVRADHAGDLRDVKESDGEDDDREGRAEHGDEHGGERDAREGHDDVHDPHDHFGDPLAGNGCHRADHGAAQQREGSGGQSDDERVSGAVEHARKDVAAASVRSEKERQVLLGGADPHLVGARLEVLAERRVRIVRSGDRRENGEKRHESEEDKGDLRSGVHRLPAAEANAPLHFFGELAAHLRPP